MSSLLDALAYLTWIDRLEGFVSGFINADWRGSARRGPAGIACGLGRTLVGSNQRRFYVPRNSSWSGAQIERFLAHYGVRIWGRGFAGDNIYFSVKERQANWAEYLLSRRGITLEGRAFNPDNAVYAEKYAPGDQPPAWADQGSRRKIPADRLLDWLI